MPTNSPVARYNFGGKYRSFRKRRLDQYDNGWARALALGNCRRAGACAGVARRDVVARQNAAGQAAGRTHHTEFDGSHDGKSRACSKEQFFLHAWFRNIKHPARPWIFCMPDASACSVCP
eukprot:3092836-Pleurochrysis_carterae.AAC.1